jgi:hypothetical protein
LDLVFSRFDARSTKKCDDIEVTGSHNGNFLLPKTKYWEETRKSTMPNNPWPIWDDPANDDIYVSGESMHLINKPNKLVIGAKT